MLAAAMGGLITAPCHEGGLAVTDQAVAKSAMAVIVPIPTHSNLFCIYVLQARTVGQRMPTDGYGKTTYRSFPIR